MSDSTVQISAWVILGAASEIEYRIHPGTGTVEFTIGGRCGLDLEMNEAGLRRCISEFICALHELTNSASTVAESASALKS